MTGILILFIISILGLVAMFWFKLHELEHGKTIYPDKVRVSADKMVRRGVDKTADAVNRVSQVPVRDLTMNATAAVAKSVGVGAKRVYKRVKNSDNKLTNFVKGKKTLERKEKRSDFLNTIEEHKRANGGGEIDEWKAKDKVEEKPEQKEE